MSPRNYRSYRSNIAIIRCILFFVIFACKKKASYYLVNVLNTTFPQNVVLSIASLLFYKGQHFKENVLNGEHAYHYIIFLQSVSDLGS